MSNDLLVVIDTQKSAEIFSGDRIKTMLDEISQNARSILPGDISTEKGRAEIKSMARKIASTKVFLDDLGKELVADIKAKATVIDDKRRDWRMAMDNLKDEIRKPVTEWEEKEKARVNDHERILINIPMLTSFPASATSADIQNRIDDLEKISERDFEEFQDRADAAIAEKYQQLKEHFKIKKKAEDDQAELDRLRKEAADRAEKDRIAAQEKAQADRDAKVAADAVEKERQRLADIAAAEAAVLVPPAITAESTNIHVEPKVVMPPPPSYGSMTPLPPTPVNISSDLEPTVDLSPAHHRPQARVAVSPADAAMEMAVVSIQNILNRSAPSEQAREIMVAIAAGLVPNVRMDQ